MIRFKNGLYSDVRIEDLIQITMDSNLETERRYEKGSHIRVFDGVDWYDASINAIDKFSIQQKLNELYNYINRKNTVALQTHLNYLAKISYISTLGKYTSHTNDDVINIFLSNVDNKTCNFSTKKLYNSKEYSINDRNKPSNIIWVY